MVAIALLVTAFLKVVGPPILIKAREILKSKGFSAASDFVCDKVEEQFGLDRRTCRAIANRVVKRL